MKKYIIKRLLQLIPILFGITLLTFVLMHTSSVDAVDMMEQNTGMAWTEEQKAAAREELGLDKSVPVQYLNWVGNMLKGDMGTSYISGQPVLQMRYGNILYLRAAGIADVSGKTSYDNLSDNHVCFDDHCAVDSVGNSLRGAKK